MGAFLAVLVRKLAEGDFGSKPAKVYWFLAGKKTWTSIAFATAALALTLAYQLGLCEPCYGYVGTLITISLGLGAVGLFDGAVRLTPPVRPTDVVSAPR